MKIKKEMEDEWFKVVAKFFARTREKKFDDLCPKLEKWKKNVIGGPKWHFKFC